MTASARAVTYKSLLHQMTQTTPTFLWNDSAAIDELSASIEDGAVGATCNPVILRGNARYRVELDEDTSQVHLPHKSWGTYRVVAQNKAILFESPNRRPRRTRRSRRCLPRTGLSDLTECACTCNGIVPS